MNFQTLKQLLASANNHFLHLNLALLAIVYVALLLPSPVEATDGETQFSDDGYRILFVTGRHGNEAKISLLKKMVKFDHDKKPIIIESKADKNLGDVPEAIKIFAQYDLVILDSASSRTAKKNYKKYQGKLTGLTGKIFAMKAAGNAELRHNISKEDANTIYQYYNNGGDENFKRLASFIKYRIQNNVASQKIKEPVIFPAIGLYHPEYKNLIFPTRKAYIEWRGDIAPGAKVIALNLQRSAIEASQS